MTRIADLLPGLLADLLPHGIANRRANWIEVARTDVADARQSWLLWALGGLFAALLVSTVVIRLLLPHPGSGIPFKWGIAPMSLVIQWSVPLAGLLVGGVAVAGEGDAGSLRALLGLPISRQEVVLGKLVGRLVVFNVMLLFGLVLAAAVMWYFYVGIDVGAYAIFVALTLFLASIFVGIGVGLSALFRSRPRATGASVSVFALVTLVWRVIPAGAFYLVDGRFPDNVAEPWNPPAWFIFLGNVNPVNGFKPFVDEWIFGVSGRVFEHGTLTYQHYHIEGSGPFYLQPTFLLCFLTLWALVPLVVGTWRFSRSDLG